MVQEVHCRVGWKWKTSSFVTVTPGGNAAGMVAEAGEARCRRHRRRDRIALARAAGQEHGREHDQGQGGGAVRTRGTVGRFMDSSASAKGVGVAGTAPIRGAKVVPIPGTAGLAEVHDPVAGMHGLGEGGARRSAVTALHL